MATLDRIRPPTTTPLATAWTPRRAIAAAVFLTVAIALVQVAQSSSFAGTGHEMQRLQTQKANLSAEVRLLEAEVAALSSLDRIERTARESLGMVPALRQEYIAVSVEAPREVLLPRPLPVMPEPQPTKSESWWRTWLSVLPLP